jgi:5-methylcytosine-specific restriction endonuclease McrA
MARRVPHRLRLFARERAEGRCEYCLVHDDGTLVPHKPDHVLAEKHGGLTTAENLAWACFNCNRFIGNRYRLIRSSQPENRATL